ncbi:MAG: AAA family ATPase [Caldilineaceae bacterium]
MPKPLPTSTSTFRHIVEGNYLYIDKTEQIYHLVKNPSAAWFLSRPRRFGKSLLISTLDELLRGNRELFRGLWIDQSDYVWETYPIIRLDFNLYPNASAEELQNNIKRYLAMTARQYGVTLADGPYYAQFGDLIIALAEQKQVVILIDEYDKPLIDNLDNLTEAIQIRATLKGFYGVIKALDRYVRTTFITGISRFTKVGVFSDLNNLTDLTFDERFAAILGITQAELLHYFADRLPVFAAKEGLTTEDLLARIRDWYDGFRFTRLDVRLYNPYSTMNLFDKSSFHNYWFESGSPTFLIQLIQQHKYDIQSINELRVEELAFSTYEIDRLAIVPLLFQTGYLTIRDYTSQTMTYQLYYPNYEVENAFLTYLLDAFSNTEQGLSTSHLWHMVDALTKRDLTAFFNNLQVLFANIDYDLHLGYEKYYQTIFYLIFKLIGLRIDAEVKTNAGRIDAVVELAERIYLFEFKLDKSAESALAQIAQHTYYQKYQARGKSITCVGVNFDTSTRGIAEWKTAEI